MGKFDERIEEFGLLVGAHETARRVEEILWIESSPTPAIPGAVSTMTPWPSLRPP
jgi:ParB family chromosome partitioning protein